MSDNGPRDVTPGRQPFTIRPRVVILVLLVLLVVGTVATSVFVVDEFERAVVLRLGRFHRIVTPGLNTKWPFGLEQNFNVNTEEQRNLEFGFRTQQAGVQTTFTGEDFPNESIMLTGDLNIVDVEWTVQYRVVDPRAWLFNVEFREQTLTDIARSVMNALVGDRSVQEVISDQRLPMQTLAREQMNAIFQSYGLGVEITGVFFRNTLPPAGPVQDAFEDVNAAIQDLNRLVNEAREEYNSAIPRAQGDAEQLVQQAQGYATERVNRARGDVARFQSVLAEYQRDPETTRQRLYFEMIEETLAQRDNQTLIDRSLENVVPLLNLGGANGLPATGTQTQGGAQ